MTKLKIQLQTWTDINRQEWTKTYRYRLGHTLPDRDRLGQTGTGTENTGRRRDKKRQEGTDRDIWGQARTGRERQGQKGIVPTSL